MQETALQQAGNLYWPRPRSGGAARSRRRIGAVGTGDIGAQRNESERCPRPSANTRRITRKPSLHARFKRASPQPPRSAELAGRRFERQRAEVVAARAVTPGNSRLSSHSRKATPAVE